MNSPIALAADSPAPSSDNRLFELRIYVTNEGKLPDLLARFRDHTIKLFEKHGIENIGYWVPVEKEEGADNTLYYIIAHNYGTGEETLIFLKDQEEYDIIERELRVTLDTEVAEFNKSVEAYRSREIGKDFVKAVKAALAQREAEANAEALRCIKFCEEEERKAEIAYEARRATWPVGPFFFGVEPRISDEDLKDLCCKPLEAKTDPLKLKELEERFPGATMVLSTPSQQGVIKYVYEDLYVDASANHKIACDFAGPLPWPNFAMLGVVAGKRPQLMAEWRGMYIDLSHLF
jgi:hypothetical protein